MRFEQRASTAELSATESSASTSPDAWSADALSGDESGTYRVHGVAIGAGDVTTGQSSIRKFWPESTLRRAADGLAEKSVVVDHDNSATSVVGQVTKSGFKSGVGVLYEAELASNDLAEAISNEWLDVSIRGHHDSVDELDEVYKDGEKAKKVTGLEFANISIVETGASGSNTLRMGESELAPAYPELVDHLDDASRQADLATLEVPDSLI